MDRSPYKQGRFLPGTHIPIYHPDRIRETKPDYVVILPWNLKDEIMQQLQYIREWGGRFVVPIPMTRLTSSYMAVVVQLPEASGREPENDMNIFVDSKMSDDDVGAGTLPGLPSLSIRLAPARLKLCQSGAGFDRGSFPPSRSPASSRELARRRMRGDSCGLEAQVHSPPAGQGIHSGNAC